MISYKDKNWADVTQPTLIVRPEIAKANIASMAQKAKQAGVHFRPHFKTHQSVYAATWFRDVGVTAITVSSVSMAQYFAHAGWTDITIAFPVNVRELESINKLAKQVSLNLVVEGLETIRILSKALTNNVKVWIKTDTGYKRTGVSWENAEGILGLIREIQQHSHLTFAGLLAHAGHAYKEHSSEGVLAIHQQTLTRLNTLKETLEHSGVTAELSLGDTPSCSLADDFTGINEIRPGNFVFYDLQQLTIGSCQVKDLSLAVACPVVAKHPERGTVIVYGGAVHFSKDFADVDGVRKFGLVVQDDLEHGNAWTARQDAYLAAVSQEHGTVKLPAELLENITIGDLILIAPAHCCLAVDLIREYRTPAGERFRAWA
jgi:D-serine deaminase-like pyridoxal phosphate-dependent protein